MTTESPKHPIKTHLKNFPCVLKFKFVILCTILVILTPFSKIYGQNIGTCKLMLSSNSSPSFKPKFDILNYSGIETLFPTWTSKRFYSELALAGMLLEQQDLRLNEHDLFVPNGGLCATTCMTNILGASTLHLENVKTFTERAPLMLARIVYEYNTQIEEDARLGAQVDLVANVTNSISDELLKLNNYNSFEETVVLTASQIRSEFYPNRIFSALRGDAIAIGSVLPAEGYHLLGHAVVILGIDNDSRRIVISDPNLPNDILSVPFEYARRGTEITFTVPYTYGEERVKLYALTTLRRNVHKIN